MEKAIPANSFQGSAAQQSQAQYCNEIEKSAFISLGFTLRGCVMLASTPTTQMDDEHLPRLIMSVENLCLQIRSLHCPKMPHASHECITNIKLDLPFLFGRVYSVRMLTFGLLVKRMPRAKVCRHSNHKSQKPPLMVCTHFSRPGVESLAMRVQARFQSIQV